MQLIVLGMHRSGTSVLARLLNLMGAYFGPEGVSTGANPENPKGFWERRDVRALNDQMLHSVGCDWNRVASFDADALPDAAVATFRDTASRLILELDANRPWFIKEPRLCLLLPLWRQLLEVPVCIRIYRHPAEVAGSLAKRNGIALPVGLALWEKYVTEAARSSADLPSIDILHDRLLSNPVEEVERLHAELLAHEVQGLRMPSKRELRSFIDPELHHQRYDDQGLREYAGDERVRMFEALQAGLPDAISTGPLPDSTVQELHNYEARLSSPPPWNAVSLAVQREPSEAPDRELRQLRERVVARDQENKLLRESVAKVEDTLARLDQRRAQDLVVQGELRARLDRSDRDLNRTAERVQTLHAQSAAAGKREQSLQAELSAAGKREQSLQAELAVMRAELADRDRRLGEYVAARIELKDKLAARAARVAELGAALTRKCSDLDERFVELAEVSRLLFDLEHRHHAALAALAARDSELAQMRSKLADMSNSRTWRMTRPLRAVGRRLRGQRGGGVAAELAAVEGSGLFDRAWYLERYPDVAGSGMDLVEHYIGFGAAEGRDPGPGFDTAAYLESNPDVREAGINPLVHYAMQGRQEGRSPK